jgi:hypothetical protein
VEARAGDGIVLAALAGAALFATPAAWDEAAWDPSDIEERRRRASLGRRALEARVRSRDRPLHVSLPSPSSEIEADVRPRVLEALAQVVADIGGRSALLMERDGALLAWHGDVDADLARRYAAAAAQGDRDVMELSMMDLFPEDEVDALLFAATPESGLRIEVAVPVGFSNDPGVAGKRLSETLDGIDRLLGG